MKLDRETELVNKMAVLKLSNMRLETRIRELEAVLKNIQHIVNAALLYKRIGRRVAAPNQKLT